MDNDHVLCSVFVSLCPCVVRAPAPTVSVHLGALRSNTVPRLLLLLQLLRVLSQYDIVQSSRNCVTALH